jgi:uncharacterized protein (TIGR00730 family)
MKKVCVFAGARDGKDPMYKSSAAELGRLIASRGDHLFYGGSFVGCMGQVARSSLEAGGKVTGIIPKIFESLITETHPNLDIIITSDLFDRKKMMIENSDIFVTFPGGIGTVDELLEVMTLNQIGLIDKPVTVLNLNGHFDWLKEKLKVFESQGFVDKGCYRNLRFLDQVDY